MCGVGRDVPDSSPPDANLGQSALAHRSAYGSHQAGGKYIVFIAAIKRGYEGGKCGFREEKKGVMRVGQISLLFAPKCQQAR